MPCLRAGIRGAPGTQRRGGHGLVEGRVHGRRDPALGPFIARFGPGPDHRGGVAAVVEEAQGGAIGGVVQIGGDAEGVGVTQTGDPQPVATRAVQGGEVRLVDVVAAPGVGRGRQAGLAAEDRLTGIGRHHLESGRVQGQWTGGAQPVAEEGDLGRAGGIADLVDLDGAGGALRLIVDRQRVTGGRRIGAAAQGRAGVQVIGDPGTQGLREEQVQTCLHQWPLGGVEADDLTVTTDADGRPWRGIGRIVRRHQAIERRVRVGPQVGRNAKRFRQWLRRTVQPNGQRPCRAGLQIQHRSGGEDLDLPLGAVGQRRDDTTFATGRWCRQRRPAGRPQCKQNRQSPARPHPMPPRPGQERPPGRDDRCWIPVHLSPPDSILVEPEAVPPNAKRFYQRQSAGGTRPRPRGWPVPRTAP